jgi:hypothetical protein
MQWKDVMRTAAAAKAVAMKKLDCKTSVISARILALIVGARVYTGTVVYVF